VTSIRLAERLSARSGQAPIYAAALIALAWTVRVLTGQTPAADLQELYRAHQWFELREAVKPASSPLLRAAVASAFNDGQNAERLLLDIVKSRPRPEFANDAYDMLCQLYARTGQYARFLTTYREWRSAFPNSRELLREKENEEKFGGRPDQKNGPRRRAILRHEEEDFSIPVSVNGKSGEYLFDTGAWQSVVTEPEAKRLGLTLREGTHFITDPSGTRVGYRTAVVKEVTIGGMRFNDVSFAVYPAPSWAPDVEFGVIGMPILIHTGSIKWSKDGTVELGGTLPQASTPNLVFSESRLLLRADFQGRSGLGILDTGATTTDFNANFASLFAELLERSGKKGMQEISGIGGTRVFESVTLPEFTMTIGPRAVALRPANVTLQRNLLIGGNCCLANVGRDVLSQAQSVSIDFAAMSLQLQ
jgi:Aspartyl protease